MPTPGLRTDAKNSEASGAAYWPANDTFLGKPSSEAQVAATSGRGWHDEAHLLDARGSQRGVESIIEPH